jgi:DNA-binding transcriptional regulator YiaG
VFKNNNQANYFLDVNKPLAYKVFMIPKDLKKWRKANNYSQGTLAKALSVHVMTVSRWERGVREIPSFLHLALRGIVKKSHQPGPPHPGNIVREGNEKRKKDFQREKD